MSEKKSKGTQMWCSECKDVTPCVAVSPAALNRGPGQRFYKVHFKDINFFRRGRVCQICSHQFLTAEVSEELIDELAVLRGKINELESSLALASVSSNVYEIRPSSELVGVKDLLYAVVAYATVCPDQAKLSRLLSLLKSGIDLSPKHMNVKVPKDILQIIEELTPNEFGNAAGAFTYCSEENSIFDWSIQKYS